MRASTAVLFVATVLIGCATPDTRVSPVAVARVPSLDGHWKGELSTTGRHVRGNPEEREFSVRLKVRGNTASVYLLEEGTWNEVKPKLFTVARQGPNAVIYAIQSGGNGGWVETWAFAVTLRSNDELLVGWLRVVNNLALPLSDPESKYGFSANGTLRRYGTSGRAP
jgi:hypothetical protein